MRDILDRLTSNAHWLVFILLEIISGILLFNYNRYQSSIFFTQANALVATIQDWEAGALSFIQLRSTNRELVAENVALQANLDSLRRQLMAQGADTTDLDRRMRSAIKGLRTIEAHVINNSVHRKNNFMTINRGTSDGVRPEMGVVSGDGVVGIVYSCSQHYSLVLPVLNSRSEISCRLRGSDFFGYLRWEGGSSLEAYLEEVPHHAKFKKGDVVETSGFSEVFPPGMYVGKVVGKVKSTDGLSYRIKVRLGCDQSLVRDVIVFSNTHREEIDTLQLQVIDLEQEEMKHIEAEKKEEAEAAKSE